MAKAIPEIKQFVKLEAPTFSKALAIFSGGTSSIGLPVFLDDERIFDERGGLVPSFFEAYVAMTSFMR